MSIRLKFKINGGKIIICVTFEGIRIFKKPEIPLQISVMCSICASFYKLIVIVLAAELPRKNPKNSWPFDMR